jgi:hypothetical protein
VGFISTPGDADWRATADRQALALRELRREIDALRAENQSLRMRLEFGSSRATPQSTPHAESAPGRKWKKFGKQKVEAE